MAITLLVSANTPNPNVIGDWNLQAAQLTACKMLLGRTNVPLTEMGSTTIPELALGTYIFHNGAIYIIDTAHFPIAVGTLAGAGTYYVKLTTSGVTLTAEWVSAIAAYSWDESNQGLYNGAAQILSYSMYFDGAAAYYKSQIINFANPSAVAQSTFRNDGIFEAPNISVINNVAVGNDLDVTGDADVGNDLGVTGNADVGGDLDVIGSVDAKEYNPKALIASNVARTTAGSIVIPAGIYHGNIYVVSAGTVSGVIETYINGAWVQVTGSYKSVTGTTGTSNQFTIISDGTNTRLTAVGAGTFGATVYLSKY